MLRALSRHIPNSWAILRVLISFPFLPFPSLPLTTIAWAGRGYEVNFQSPKDDEKKLSLLAHGERAYDHVILFPPKSKGSHPPASCWPRGEEGTDRRQDTARR